MQQSNNSVRGFVSKLAKSPPDVPRLFVKYFKGDSSSDISSSDYLDATWENYRLLISSIFRNVNAPQISFQTLYEACSNLCCVGEGAELYNHLYDELVVYFVDMRSFLVNMASSNDNFLDYLLKSWRSTCDHIARISEVFIELDRRYALRNTSYRSISNLGSHLFGEHIIQEPLIKERLIVNLIYLIRLNRKSRIVDNDLIESAIGLVQEVCIYSSDFEPRLLQDTESYYQKDAARLFEKLTIQEYLLYAQRRQFFEEHQMPFIPHATRTAMGTIAIKTYIGERMTLILERGLPQLIDSNDMKIIRILYNATESQYTPQLREHFVNYIKSRSAEKLNQYNKDMKNVKFLFKFKNKLERIVVEGFNKELSFMRALSTTFESIVQSRDSAFAIAIATYIDGKLQSLKKNSDILKLERAFEDTMLVFRSLKGKATFETIYERMLMTRLMLNTSQVESEKKMLTKLQHACGSDYTANLQKIIDDYEMSQNINAEFNCSQAPSSDFSFTVVTVSQQAWSFPTSSNLLLPEEIRDYHRRYEEFFKRCNRGKSLRWAHPLSVCRIEAHLPRGGIEIIANVLQTLVLMLFNSYEKQNWAYDEIAAATNIDEKNLKRTLWTLSCDMGKSLLLKDTPDPNFIDAADIFTYNTKLLIQDSLDLYSRFVRYDTDREIPLQETKARHASSRSYQVDAAIIRVMKSKTKASYHELNDAVTERLVHINPDDLERSIKSLITRGMIEWRAAENEYVYIP